jgi:hypothetical protein
MTNYFEIAAQLMEKFGFYQYFFPFAIIAAVVFGLLKKSKILGESTFLNGLIALCVSFIAVFGIPISTGLNLAPYWSTFFMQISVFMIIFFVGLLMATLFYPNISEWLPKVFTSRSMLMIMVVIAIVIFISSGLVGALTLGITGPPQPGKPTAPRDVIILVVGIFLFVVFIMIAGSIQRMTK